MLHALAGPAMCLLIQTMHFLFFIIEVVNDKDFNIFIPLYSELDERLYLILL